MFEKEKNLPPDQRIDFVSVVTPNHVHYAPAKMALESGFHVVVEKPIAFSVAEAKSLQKLVEKTGLILELLSPSGNLCRYARARGLILFFQLTFATILLLLL